ALVRTTSGGSLIWNDNSYFDTSGKRSFSYNIAEWQTYSSWKQSSHFDSTSQYLTERPSGARVYVRANKYDSNRAYIVIYNWALTPTVDVDLSAVLQAGDNFEIRDVQNLFGPVILQERYKGKRIHLAMSGNIVASPVGYEFTPKHTGPEFNVFII